MKLKKLPIGNYFRFVENNPDDATVWQKVSEQQIRHSRSRSLSANKHLGSKNVEDLGADYQLPELIKFKQLTKGHFFIFRDCKTVYQKLTTYYIRPFGSAESMYYRKNGEVQDLGEEFSQFTQPIHIQARSVESGE